MHRTAIFSNGLIGISSGLARFNLKSAAVFTVACGGAFLADEFNRPITCALIFVFGVTIIAGFEGAVRGAMGAVAASIVYSFLIRDPAFSFSLRSADDLVPIIAFNLSAIASGIFAGRLKDRINDAERATRRLEALMKISTSLHSAMKLEDITAALERFTGRPAELYIGNSDGDLSFFGRSEHSRLADALVEHSQNHLLEGRVRGYRFTTPAGAPCVAVLDTSDGDDLSADEDAGAVVALLNVTVERCLLLAELKDGRSPRLQLVASAP